MNFQKKSTAGRMDMLQGSLVDKLIFFTIPLAASSILQQLFNSVDVAVVGRFNNSQAQAAVGCNGSVINLLLNLFIGISVGTNVVIARYIGEEKKEKIKDTIHTSMLVAIVCGVFLVVVGMLIAGPILIWMDTPEDIMEQAILYLRIYFIGMPFIMIYNFGAAILRSFGDSKRPLCSLVLSGSVNALLNMFLVIVCHLGVSGVAIATVISNAISAGMVWYFLAKEQSSFHLDYRGLKLNRVELVKILKIGVPAGIQTTVFSVSNVFIQKALNSYGSDVLAGSAVTVNFEFITYFIIAAFTQSAVTFTSQNFGARKYARCKKIFWITLWLSMVLTACLSWTFILGRGFFISLFSSEPEVMKYASIRMVQILSFNFIAATYEVGGACLRGIGYSMMPALLTVFGTCVLRLFWIYWICDKSTEFATFLHIYPISWVITGIIVLAAYFWLGHRTFSE